MGESPDLEDFTVGQLKQQRDNLNNVIYLALNLFVSSNATVNELEQHLSLINEELARRDLAP